MKKGHAIFMLAMLFSNAPSMCGKAAEMRTLVAEDAEKRVLVPSSENWGFQLGNRWRALDFDDSSWISGKGGVGYEIDGGDYEPFFSINVQEQMYRKRTSTFIRIPFKVEGEVPGLLLRIRYDDGFVAYLNGQEVGRALFEGEPRWNSVSQHRNVWETDLPYDNLDISESLGALRQGKNILAIQGLQDRSSSSDFLIGVELHATTKAQIARVTARVRRSDWQPSRGRAGDGQGPRKSALTGDPQSRVVESQDGIDWPQYLGPNQNNLNPETGLMKSWPEGGPKILWQQPVGVGFSCLAVKGGRLFTMGQYEKQIWVIALNSQTGELLWTVPTSDREYLNFVGPRSTPTVDGDRVYTVDPYGNLLCLAAKDGEVLWKKRILRDFRARSLRWGVAFSPVIDQDNLILSVGQSLGNSVVVVNKNTGAVIWRNHNDKAGYATPVIATIDGKRQYVFFWATGVVGMLPDSGKILWRVPWQTRFDAHAATPVVVGDTVFISSGYNQGCAKIEIDFDEDPPTKVTTSKLMRCQHATPIIIDGYVYGFDARSLRCIELKTFRSQWETHDYDQGTLTFADGLAYILSIHGSLFLAKLSPEKLEVISEKPDILSGGVPGMCWTPPVIANRKLYLRDHEKLVCLDISQAERSTQLSQRTE